MALETGTYISDLVATNPQGSDSLKLGYAHIQLIKKTLKNTLPLASAQIVATAAELNTIDGVTSNIQPQLDLKAPVASPVLTGLPTVPTPSVPNEIREQVASVNYVIAAALSSTLSSQTGNANKVYKADGVSGEWSGTIDTGIVTAGANGRLITVTGVENVAAAKTWQNLAVADGTDDTKKAQFNAASITAATTRDLIVADRPTINIYTPMHRLVDAGYLAGQSQIDILFNYGYAGYVLELSEVDVTSSVGESPIKCRFNLSGTWVTSTTYWSLGINAAQSSGILFPKVSYTTGDEGAVELTINDVLTSRVHSISGLPNDASVPSPIRTYNTTSGTFDGIRILSTGNPDSISAGWRLYGITT